MNTIFHRRIYRTAGILAPAAAIFLGLFTAVAQNIIVIRGSNTIGEELAPQLIAAYQKDHKDVTFDLEFKGTDYGLGALMGNYCDIAAASKTPGTEQQEIAQIRNFHFKDYIIGSYAVSLVVNATNPISNLTGSQVAALFTGGIQNWKGIGGADAPVHLFGRDPVSGTHLGFKELAMANQFYGTNVQYFTNYSDIASAVAKDADGIGYIGLMATPPAGTKIVNIGGIAPGDATVNDKTYPYVRTLRFYTDADKEPAAVADFIKFTLSPQGQAILVQMGYAPKP
jgi:phosphate transport system substrate-binding protein